MKYLLDTNACVSHLRSAGKSKVGRRLAAASGSDVVLCSIVRSELVFGAHRSRDAATNLAEVLLFVNGFASLPFDDVAADICGELRAKLTGSGLPIGPYDIMIASIALANGVTLVTHNTSEFQRVPNLAIDDWEL